MFDGLQKKWKVSGGRVLLILITFAVGGSVTGYLGKKIMGLTGIRQAVVFIPVYILLITLLWPFMVLCISVFTGQFHFFRHYIEKLARRMGMGRNSPSSNRNHPSGQAHPQNKDLNNETEILPANDKSPSAGHRGIKHLVIFASGAGSNAKNIIEYFRDTAKAKVVLIVCNKPGAGVLEVARNENIPVLHIEKERFFKGDGYLPELQNVQADLLILAGFLWKVPDTLIHAYPKQIINIHPALLPKYGGKGMYGQFVHMAVVAAGELQSGITIHYVDEAYDNGDVIFQAACPVIEGDTPEDLAARIHEMEHLHYPQVIEKLLTEHRP